MREQFIQACEEHSDALFRYCYFKISDRDLAKDLVQETFMRTWNSLAKGQEIENIRAFFYRVLGNIIIDEYRRKKTVSLDQLREIGFDPGVNEVASLEDKIDGAQALAMLKKIPEAYQEVIFMRYVQELTLKEIAEITKDKENTVAVKIHRGIEKMRKIFNQT